MTLKNIVCLTNFYIKRSFRKQGLGSLLLQKTCQCIFEDFKNCKYIYLEPAVFEKKGKNESVLLSKEDPEYSKKQEALIKFYEKNGFQRSTTTPFFLYLASSS